MAGVSDHLAAIRQAYRTSIEDGDRLIDELQAYGDELDHEAQAWIGSSAAAVAQLMDAHARASSSRRALAALRLGKLA